MLITLRQHLKIELDKDPSETTPYLRTALKYLDKFWDNNFVFLKDGSLPIDNNLAERAIRPLTTQRNAMLHFGSDEGVEMTATYHSIISMAKTEHSHPLGMVVSTHFRCGKGVKRGLKNGALPFNID